MDGFRCFWIVRLILGFVVALAWLPVQGWAWNWVVAQERDLSLVAPANEWCVRADSISLGAPVRLSTCKGLDFPNERWFYDPSNGSFSLLLDSGNYGSLCLDSALASHDGCRNASFLLVLAKCSGVESQKWDHKEHRFQYGPSHLTGGKTMFLQGFPDSDCAENLTIGENAPQIDFKLVAPPGPTGRPPYVTTGAGDQYVRSRSNRLRHRFLGPGEGGHHSSFGTPHDVEVVSLAATAALGWALAITFFLILWFSWRKYRSVKSKELTTLIEKSGPFPSSSAADFDTPRIRHYGFKEIEIATDSFTTLVGKEEYWETYLARFPDQDLAVVWREIRTRQYEPDFELEMLELAKIRHHCLVDILGFCDESGEHMVVFEYMPRGTLHDRLHRSKGAALLTWVHRMHIAYDMASGLGHMHQYVHPPIIHGNMKSSKICLGEHYSAKVADWCLFKLRRQDALASNFHWANLNSTLGFPQVDSPKACGIKNDVYNFGLILLELLSGVPGSERTSSWTQIFSASQQEPLSLVDPLLREDVDVVELHAVVDVAKLCVNNLERRRPCMLEVERIFKEKLWKSLRRDACLGTRDSTLCRGMSLS